MPNRQRVKLSELLPPNSGRKPHRPERVGRPKNRPRINLNELLKREIKHILKEEGLD